MTRDEAIKELKEDKMLYETDVCHAGDGTPDGRLLEALEMAIEALHQKGAYEQTKWERDMALQTLEEHGIGLGQKAEYIIPSGDVMFTSEVVRCKDCRYFKKIVERSDSGLCHRDLVATAWKENGYCSRGERREPSE